jgi:hypothetical protein
MVAEDVKEIGKPPLARIKKYYEYCEISCITEPYTYNKFSDLSKSDTHLYFTAQSDAAAKAKKGKYEGEVKIMIF